jgi:hypothetical protein
MPYIYYFGLHFVHRTRISVWKLCAGGWSGRGRSRPVGCSGGSAGSSAVVRDYKGSGGMYFGRIKLLRFI